MKHVPIRYGMIGGGPGAFIGAVHRMAARLDGHYDLVAGCFSSQPGKNEEMNALPGLGKVRLYNTYEQLISGEQNLPEDQRIQVLSIVTPNHLHYPPARLALESGFDVIIDKPIAFDSSEAASLIETSDRTGKKICLTHTYSAYPMLRQARVLIENGTLGIIRKIYVEYPQGWLSTPLEQTDQKQASWRTDPSKSGKAGALGDIGTHAFNLLEFCSGLKASSLLAQLNTVIEGRKLDDDAVVLLKMENGATAVIMATQVATGEENNLKLRIYGSKCSVSWEQLHNNTLLMHYPDKPSEIFRTANSYNDEKVQTLHRVPAGHPEGYLEAFANIYTQFALELKGLPNAGYPTAEEGLRGMRFIDAAVDSSNAGNTWVSL